MITTHNLGFPRIGAKRELKFALENYWKGKCSVQELEAAAASLKQVNIETQKSLDYVPVGDFSLYDHMLDMTFMLGHLPPRAQGYRGSATDNYFRLARGRSAGDTADTAISAGEMTKWFDTNYHYIVPEFDASSTFNLDASRLLRDIEQAKQLGVRPKPVIVGPGTYLRLGKSKDGTGRLQHLEPLLEQYDRLLGVLAGAGVDWVQIDEPVLVTELDERWRDVYRQSYDRLAGTGVRLLLATYFGRLEDNLPLVTELPVDGIHVDCSTSTGEVIALASLLPADKILSAGVISGRNVWKTDLNEALDWLEPLAGQLGERLWLAPGCSLLHVPVDLAQEKKLAREIRAWLAFGMQKLDELTTLAQGLNKGRDSIRAELDENAAALASRRISDRVTNPAIQRLVSGITDDMTRRRSAYAKRRFVQAERLKLPAYPTTTIGSFPQTTEIRQIRRKFKSGELTSIQYRDKMQQMIASCIKEQEALGLDVLVHGEPERNDMVEFFGEQLTGCAFTEYGWVQSYGSRGVKPPIIFGDVSRPRPMTVDWARYAQSITEKPVKGMLTGPVTILNWSFVRDDQPEADTCMQIALAIRDEVLDLEKAGIRIIQIDEAALREGLPLRKSEWQGYLDWAIRAFKVSANGVGDDTQIHTHMCYSEFNDIMLAIADMDADVITIENSRSDLELLSAFDEFKYPNEIGPGVYDIHSPNVPPVAQILDLMRKASHKIPAERLWVNPDCGLKTRRWEEVRPALTHMVAAAKQLRQESRAGTD